MMAQQNHEVFIRPIEEFDCPDLSVVDSPKDYTVRTDL